MGCSAKLNLASLIALQYIHINYTNRTVVLLYHSVVSVSVELQMNFPQNDIVLPVQRKDFPPKHYLPSHPTQFMGSLYIDIRTYIALLCLCICTFSPVDRKSKIFSLLWPMFLMLLSVMSLRVITGDLPSSHATHMYLLYGESG